MGYTLAEADCGSRDIARGRKDDLYGGTDIRCAAHVDATAGRFDQHLAVIQSDPQPGILAAAKRPKEIITHVCFGNAAAVVMYLDAPIGEVADDAHVDLAPL